MAMMTRAFLALALAAAAPVAQARAQSVMMMAMVPCGSADDMRAAVARYGEVKSGAGLAEGGKFVVEHTLSPDGSWTVLRTDAQGLTCILATGKDWLADPAPAAPGNPT